MIRISVPNPSNTPRLHAVGATVVALPGRPGFTAGRREPATRSDLHAAAAFGVSANAESNAFNNDAIVSSVSSPMLEMRKVFPFSFP
jgi:hypothetical protein